MTHIKGDHNRGDRQHLSWTMDVSATRRFLSTNVAWPHDQKFFIPDGGLRRFLESNLRFKVFLVMMAVFTDAYATETVRSLTSPQLAEIRLRVKDIVRHMVCVCRRVLPSSNRFAVLCRANSSKRVSRNVRASAHPLGGVVDVSCDLNAAHGGRIRWG